MIYGPVLEAFSTKVCHVVTVDLTKKQIELLKRNEPHKENASQTFENSGDSNKSMINESIQPYYTDNAICPGKLYSDKIALYKDQRDPRGDENKQPSKDDSMKSAELNSKMGSWSKPTCGCLKTSEKLKELLKRFPTPTPPPPTPVSGIMYQKEPDIYCANIPMLYCPHPMTVNTQDSGIVTGAVTGNKSVTNKLRRLPADFVQIIQLLLTALALVIYYIVFCYMQLIYYVLVSAIFFHNADGPMKITIGVVTVTTLVVAFNLLLRMERFVGINPEE